jgi:hypothetical protein
MAAIDARTYRKKVPVGASRATLHALAKDLLESFGSHDTAMKMRCAQRFLEVRNAPEPRPVRERDRGPSLLAR